MALAVPGTTTSRIARPFFQQGEPEDSVYRLAHEVLNRGDYGRAAQMFKDIAQKYPKSVYENDLPYYEAWARYRIGTTEELHTAAKLLEPRASKLPASSPSRRATAATTCSTRGAARATVTSLALYIRINSALAQRGDPMPRIVVAKLAQAGANTCDREEMQVKIEAMSALSQMDPTAALPIIRRVLDKKDECTDELRQRAVFMLGRRGDAEAATLLATAAKSDPSMSVRIEAINWLPKLQGDAGVDMLEELLRTEQDEHIQRSVVRTLTSSDNAKARSSMRALIDRKDAPISLRVEAINSFNSDRATTDDAAYLRSLYGRADNDRIKEAIIGALGRIGGPENDAVGARHRAQHERAEPVARHGDLAPHALEHSGRRCREALRCVRLVQHPAADRQRAGQSQGDGGGGQARRHREERARSRAPHAGVQRARRARRIRAATQLLNDILDGKGSHDASHHTSPPPRSSWRPARCGTREQSLANRVRSAPDGRVQFTFAARPGVCGNGRTYIQTGPNSITGSVNYNGNYYGNCNDAHARRSVRPGPVRVVIDRADKLPLSVQTYVGPPDTTLRGVTDLGRVRAQDAADYLLSLANTVDGRAGRDALFPAMLADSANTAAALVSIAKNTALPRETRRSALSYMGRSTDGMQTIPASVTDPILAIARDESDNQSVRQQALSVLGRLDHGAGIPSLIQLSQQTQSNWLAKESMSTLVTLGRSARPPVSAHRGAPHRSARRSAHRRAPRARPGVRDGAGRRAASRALSRRSRATARAKPCSARSPTSAARRTRSG